MSIKAEEIFHLATRMQGTSEGLSLGEIQHAFNVSRRTAERMRDSVERIFPQMEEAPSDGRMKKWRLPSGTLNGLVSFETKDLLALENAKQQAAQSGHLKQVEDIDAVLVKVAALTSPKQRHRIAPDLEALMEAEGFLFRPGPRPVERLEHLQTIRRAILESRKIQITYHSSSSHKSSRQKICPYGVIYGHRNYLVAYNLNPSILDFRLYRLSGIKDILILSEVFERDMAFSLRDFMKNSFGVFQEPPFDVVWKFAPEVSDDVRTWIFHPNQTTENLEDGSIVVRFRAGGRQEMEWFLHTWGEWVEDLTNYSSPDEKIRQS